MKNILTKLCIALAISVAAISCKKDSANPELRLRESEVTIHFDETFQIEVLSGETVENPGKFTFYSSDPSIGEINDNGLFTAKKIGETEIRVEGGNSLRLNGKITVEPYFNLFREPSKDFGASPVQVKSYEDRELASETVSALLYEAENSNSNGIMYMFDNGKLESVIVMLSDSETLMEQIATFYSERYTYEGTSDDVFFFSDEDAGLIVAIGFMETFGLTAAYFPESSEQATMAMSNLNKGKKLDLKSISK